MDNFLQTVLYDPFIGKAVTALRGKSQWFQQPSTWLKPHPSTSGFGKNDQMESSILRLTLRSNR